MSILLLICRYSDAYLEGKPDNFCVNKGFEDDEGTAKVKTTDTIKDGKTADTIKDSLFKTPYDNEIKPVNIFRDKETELRRF